MRKQITVAGIKIGNAPIVVQSMCKSDTRDIKSTLKEIKSLKKAKCQIARLAIPDQEALDAFKEITKNSPLPIIADIHFDYTMAIKAIKNGASKIRFNPGNIGNEQNIREVVKACKKAHTPIRIGVNAGSLEKEYLEKTPENLTKSALRHVKILEDMDFFEICVSIKSSDVITTIEANRLLYKSCPYPIHIGLTEAGLKEDGSIKSSLALSPLILEGIGDTIRISLTDTSDTEVHVAYKILQGLGKINYERHFVSCPTCGRCQNPSHKELAKKIYKNTQDLDPNIHIAVMGCIVNGPGEAKDADFAIVCGGKNYAFYKKGQFIKKISNPEEFISLIKNETDQ
ncbi:MAG: flavodoxin-dependent (E)-4-hydroxy-3-methylbut-2-enyl-diphosphate synthase [Candidatus Gracilibacteria bacterium]|jgi:(E)-4-hydroxy-3-methylbut-2-enyl-diphosphate synthase|nr:flavodoxin-dependent (E)-4-hydroxy-3-methylbut-2-enyl-diphosphate synthase [Candidatus Gracilibacteria bacterium]